MVTKDRKDRARPMRIEALESRQLLSGIDAPPTLRVLNGPGVHVLRSGAVSIVNPTLIRVTGTAQPGAPGTAVTVGIFAEDKAGDVINNGQPLAVVTPNFLGQYHATIALPSLIRKDVNFLVAREEAVGTQVSQLTINGTTLNGLSGAIALNPGSLSGLSGSISTPTLGINLNGTTTTQAANASLNGTTTTQAANASLNGTTTTQAANASLNGTTTQTGGGLSLISGSIDLDQFPIALGGNTGTGGNSNGIDGSITALSGTIGGLNGSLTGTSAIPSINGTLTGTSAIPSINGTLTGTSAIPSINGASVSAGTLAAGASSFVQSGTATLSGLTGTFSGGTGTIAPTTGTTTQVVDDVAVSDPVTILIHQSRTPLVARPLSSAAANRAAVLAAVEAARGTV